MYFKEVCVCVYFKDMCVCVYFSNQVTPDLLRGQRKLPPNTAPVTEGSAKQALFTYLKLGYVCSCTMVKCVSEARVCVCSCTMVKCVSEARVCVCSCTMVKCVSEARVCVCSCTMVKCVGEARVCVCVHVLWLNV